MSSAGLTLSLVRNESHLPPVHINPGADMYPDESILIYVSLPGSTIPMRVLKSDSIESVKLRIQSYQGFVVRNQKLVCKGRELARSNSLIRDYGVTDENVLHLVLRLSDLQVIEVTTFCGKCYTFNVERGKNVGYVKEQIAKKGKEFVDLDEQEVVHDGERLEDQRLIEDICKQKGSVLHLLVRKSSKVRTKPVEKNFELSVVAPEIHDKRNDEIHLEKKRILYGVFGNNHSRHFGSDPPLIRRRPLDLCSNLEPFIGNPKVELPTVILDMVQSAFEGLTSGNSPVMSREGTGGVYFMPDRTGQKYVGVFKPIDEEPLAVNNPQGLPLSSSGEGLKKGTRVGEGALREVAAYILDHPNGKSWSDNKRGFAGVPPTTMIKCLHPGFNHPNGLRTKIGSFQMFTENYGNCEDMGPGAFPVEEVHKISVLDIRLANADRHGGNILLSKDNDGNTVLIPIDHGYCLPESFEDCTFEWLYWPQVRKPYSPEIADYIKSLDAEEDIALLKFYGWKLPLEVARTLRVSTMLLKKGVEKGLTPFDIGSIMCRETLTRESILEEMLQEAKDAVLPGTSEATFLEALSEIMDRRLEKICS